MNLKQYLDTADTEALDPYVDRIKEHLLLAMKLQAENKPYRDVMDARIDLFVELQDWLEDDAKATPVPDDEDWAYRSWRERRDERYRRLESRNDG